jgi:hypothetical protein
MRKSKTKEKKQLVDGIPDKVLTLTDHSGSLILIP